MYQNINFDLYLIMLTELLALMSRIVDSDFYIKMYLMLADSVLYNYYTKILTDACCRTMYKYRVHNVFMKWSSLIFTMNLITKS